MNIAKKIDEYNEDNIYFCEPIKNNIINDGNFIRIIYSTYNVVLNGVYLYVTITDITCESYYTKYKCNFNTLINKEIINNLKNIEENLLKKSEIINKIPQFKIYEQLKNGNIKIFNDIGNTNITSSFILKISGIWETIHNYGLTYKFITPLIIN